VASRKQEILLTERKGGWSTVGNHGRGVVGGGGGWGGVLMKQRESKEGGKGTVFVLTCKERGLKKEGKTKCQHQQSQEKKNKKGGERHAKKKRKKTKRKKKKKIGEETPEKNLSQD